tara:strand:- start:2682 stop:2951 length:270 start_codon:yes stop_codon:yes gene_type:complete
MILSDKEKGLLLDLLAVHRNNSIASNLHKKISKERTTEILEQEILSALKINRDVNWIENDPNDEFDNLITFVKKLFKKYRGETNENISS